MEISKLLSYLTDEDVFFKVTTGVNEKTRKRYVMLSVRKGDIRTFETLPGGCEEKDIDNAIYKLLRSVGGRV